MTPEHAPHKGRPIKYKGWHKARLKEVMRKRVNWTTHVRSIKELGKEGFIALDDWKREGRIWFGKTMRAKVGHA